MNVLVDTNVISELRRGRNAAPAVATWFAAIPPENVFTSVIVLGEIRRGIELVARHDKPQAAALLQWYGSVRERLGDRVLDVDEPVMTLWARISVPDVLPAYDGLIAATGLLHGLIVVTRNTRDYHRAGVEVFNPWLDRR
ncbi:MAG: type II toxin-antitoxin system VapC family toxin [Xanthobacteraceae bacterium]